MHGQKISSGPSMTDSPETANLLRKVKILRELRRRERQNKLRRMFPDEGPFRRELYPKQMEYFKAGAIHRERLLMAANRIGKTEAGGYETALHLTGRYPDWWEGKRFDEPINALAAGDTGQSTRDIIQQKMLGGLWGTEEYGTGIIPGDCLGKPTPKSGIANAYEEVKVKHVSGGWSTFKLRSYDQGRRIFQGFELHLFWPDEEVPQDVYSEGLIRTMTTQGIVIMTFTPLSGLTPLVLDFMHSMDDQEPI